MVRRSATAAALVVLVAGLVPALTGCGEDDGPKVTREVVVEDVTAVEIAASGDLTVRRGTTPSLTVTASERTQDRLVSEVRDGVLVLGPRDGWLHSTSEVTYELVVTDLQRLRVSGEGDVTGTDVTGDQLLVQVDGSGDVELTGVDGQDVRVEIEGEGDVDLTGLDADVVRVAIPGSGEVRLRGRAASTSLRIDGDGDVHAEALRTDDADVSIGGSGDVQVDARRALHVSIEGTGWVTYLRDPEVVSDVRGDGGVERA